ncbi:MAG TPA: T9SS type A sorting domain-containing protein, partial [Caldithrix sp.]|nr:T9SS type A sorting domain-containing protein [Caldithrix sp.]
IDMTFGQRLPNDNAYNFKGILDDIRIYNYGLSVQEIQNIYTTGIKFHHTSPGEFPEQFVLYQNYPNPFNPTTTIAFSLPGRSDVSLKIFDLSGKEVETLLKKQLPAGRYSVDWDASRFASGIYFCRLKSAQNVSVRKLLLIH